jgi:hypothetical protein
MTDTKDDMLAFPVTAGPMAYSSGMTLRDYFAGQFLAGVVGNHEAMIDFARVAVEEPATTKNYVVKAAYDYADAMLIARKQEG